MDSDIERLNTIAGQLPETEAATLLAFAEFLLQRSGSDGQPQDPAPIAEPEPIERPAEESVVAAIKRLTATFPMLGRKAMFDDTSTLMLQHMMQGKPASEVIDELEVLFRRRYDELVGRKVD